MTIKKVLQHAVLVTAVLGGVAYANQSASADTFNSNGIHMSLARKTVTNDGVEYKYDLPAKQVKLLQKARKEGYGIRFTTNDDNVVTHVKLIDGDWSRAFQRSTQSMFDWFVLSVGGLIIVGGLGQLIYTKWFKSKSDTDPELDGEYHG